MTPAADEPASGADAGAALDAIARKLYALPPEEFTAARNARAATADRALAMRIKALRKPTASAWAVDLLARDGQLAEALELSEALREAQDDLDGEELKSLSRQRRALVAALAGQAVDLAKTQGVTISAAAREDVEKTINAAVMDAAAAAAVMTARLVRPLEASGFDAVDVSDAVGGTLPGVPDAPAPSRDDLAERRARKAAEKALREAERAAGEAGRELAKIDAKLEKSRERGDHLRERIGDLRAELARFEADAEKADAETRRLDDERTDAVTRAKAAERDAEKARKALE
ncbi:transposase [uncultured Microbacterium sp.]|uniref:transposase n=1 Tax=uncultured Microbacterium sp. TaxID=191216 RepID=UPI0028D8840C|nr:transposase [uncultured Microbacterium sp.]